MWLRDRSNGGEIELTQPLPGAKIGNSTLPVISGDGCYAAVLTEMPFDLFRDDDTGDRWDVYRMKLPNCGGDLNSWELISTNAFRGDDAVAADDVDPRFPPAISGSGSVIAYTHKFDSAQPDLDGVIVVDLTKPAGQPGHALPVAGTPTAAPNSSLPLRRSARAIGVRRRSVRCLHVRRQLVEGRRRTGARARSPATSPARRSTCGTGSAPIPTPRSSEPRSAPTAPPTVTPSSPAISADGTYVAFSSTAVNLVIGASLPPCIDTCPPQIYRYNRLDGTIVLVSRVPASLSPQIVGSDLGATQPAISSDGSQVAFVTRSTNLMTTRPAVGGTATDGDIMVSNVDVAEIYRASILTDGVTPAPAANAHPKLSATGRVIVFDTLAGAAYNPLAVPTAKLHAPGRGHHPAAAAVDRRHQRRDRNCRPGRR